MDWSRIFRSVRAPCGMSGNVTEGASRLERIPEPHLVMDLPEAVEAWDKGSEHGGPLVPLYHFNVLAMSRLLPQNGRVVDLACGSGRFLVRLTTGRLDIECIGIELSPGMLELAERNVRAAGAGSS